MLANAIYLGKNKVLLRTPREEQVQGPNHGSSDVKVTTLLLSTSTSYLYSSRCPCITRSVLEDWEDRLTGIAIRIGTQLPGLASSPPA